MLQRNEFKRKLVILFSLRIVMELIIRLCAIVVSFTAIPLNDIKTKNSYVNAERGHIADILYVSILYGQHLKIQMMSFESEYFLNECKTPKFSFPLIYF